MMSHASHCTRHRLRITFYVLSMCLLFIPFVSAHQRLLPEAFEGDLRLTRVPRVGSDATLILSIRSNLSQTAQAQIWFRLPHGVTSQSRDLFDPVYFPPHTGNQQYSVLLHVDKPGSYPLQASVYATLADGRTLIQHFYTYLWVAPTYSQVSSEPFDQPVDRRALETRRRSRTFRANAGEVTVRGTVLYFDDNERMELPIKRPQVFLYLETSTGNDIEIASTFADERGEYIFENLTVPELNDGKPRDLYVVVRFDNHVLSITNQRRTVYELQSETVRDVPDGETLIDLLLDASHPNRGLGHIFNTIQRAHDFLLDRVGWERDRPVRVIWPGTGRISYYSVDEFGGQVSSEIITIAPGPDQWHRITMYHEYGHAVMTAAYGYNYDSVPRGTYQGAHRLETVSDPGFAFSEGWPEFLEAAVDNRALNVIGNLNQEGELPNIETNRWWTGHVDGDGSNVSGEQVEGAVASILWDIFDTGNSLDHQPGVDDDGIADRLDLLWATLVNDRPQDITDVAIAWRKRGFPMLEELEAIYATHHALSRTNMPPTFQFLSPSVDVALADRSFQVAWDSTDPDGDDFTIDLFYDRDQRPGNSTLIQVDIASTPAEFSWNTNPVTEGKYFLRAVVTDSRNATADVYSDSVVIVDHTPLLPPEITSETHPDPDHWYANSSPQLDLRTQPDQTDRRLYSFVLNHEREIVPDTIPDVRVRNNTLTLPGLSDGVWWVHVRARDELGYWTDASHFQIQIDITPPPTVSNLRWVTANSPEIALTWDAVEDTSGITGYRVQIDVDSRDFQSELLFDGTVDGNVTRYSFSGEPNKVYYAWMKAENGADVLSRNWSAITPGVTISSPQAWDVNRDGGVNIADLLLVASHFGKPIAGDADPNPDVNRDGVVDISDLVLVAVHFDENLSAGPEIRDFANQLIAQYAKRNTQYTLHSVTETGLLPNYPNPFNPETWIPYELAAPADVRLGVYAVTGELIRRLDLGWRRAGRYYRRTRAAYWDGRDGVGEPVASGVYFYVLHVTDASSEQTYTRKMTLSK